MKIRTKLASLIAVNVAVLGAVAVYSVREVGSVRRQIAAIADHDLPLANALGRMAQAQIRIGLQLERVLRLAGVGVGGEREAALAAAKEALVAQVEREVEDLHAIERSADRLLRESDDPLEKEELDKVTPAVRRIEERFGGYRRETARVLGLVAARRLDEAAAAVPQLMVLEDGLELDAAALAADVQNFASAAAARAKAREDDVVRHVALGGVAGMAVGLCLGAFYALSITRPLRTAVQVARRLAAGDRRFVVPAGGSDETGAVLRAMGGMAAEIADDEEALQKAHDRSERLLLNVLPRPIAERLKEKPDVIADGFSDVTVLFADVVGFTALSARVSPSELVRMLNSIFSEFDRLAEKHGLEKIKTIGDCYMAVGGLPVPRPDHAQAVAEMAMDMQRSLDLMPPLAGEPLRIRIGVHSGPVVAGVIGLRKFIYDLWGDTVNVASRMESHGLPGEIQVSEATHGLLGATHRFEPRGTIAVKGRGEMTTYLLRGRLDTAHPTAASTTTAPPAAPRVQPA